MSAAASRRRSFLGTVALALCLAAPASYAAGTPVDKPAPLFTRTGLSGAPVNLRAYRGKVVLLNFWATWCAPCQLEMPQFTVWQSHYNSQGLQVVGISMDDDAGPVRRAVARLKLNYPVAMGDEKLGALYGGVLGLPLTYLIDRKGVVRAQFQGETPLSAIEDRLKALLAQP